MPKGVYKRKGSRKGTDSKVASGFPTDRPKKLFTVGFKQEREIQVYVECDDVREAMSLAERFLSGHKSMKGTVTSGLIIHPYMPSLQGASENSLNHLDEKSTYAKAWNHPVIRVRPKQKKTSKRFIDTDAGTVTPYKVTTK